MCDTLVAVTDDGPVFAKNSDRDVNEPQLLRWYAAADHPAGTEVAATWSNIPQVRRTHAVLLSQPWWMWGAEIGANEHGVVIGNEAVFTRRTGRGTTGELLGMDLLRLALERATTADDAVEVIVTLLERHGQGGSCSHEHPRFRYDNSYLVADRSGAVVLETAGRHWATEPVTGPGRSISNGLTIPGFAEKYADPVRSAVAACRSRRTLTEAAAGRAAGPATLFAALRLHGAGVDSAPTWSPVNGSLHAPCVHGGGLLTGSQTTASWVADLRAGGSHWVTGTSAPCLSVFKPVQVTTPVDIDPQAMPSNRFDPAYRWWRHETLHRAALRHAGRALALIAPQRDALEASWLAERPTSTDAFAAADDLAERLLGELSGLPDTDLRPRWLQRQWHALDRAARLGSNARRLR